MYHVQVYRIYNNMNPWMRKINWNSSIIKRVTNFMYEHKIEHIKIIFQCSKYERNAPLKGILSCLVLLVISFRLIILMTDQYHCHYRLNIAFLFSLSSDFFFFYFIFLLMRGNGLLIQSSFLRGLLF